MDDAAPARPDDAGLDRAVARGPPVRLELAGLSRPGPGTSIRIAGRCCSCSARGARSAARASRGRSSTRRATLYFCIAYLVFALVMTMAGKFPDFGALFPHWLYRHLQSERQDQSRALPLPAFRRDRDHGDPVRAEGLAGRWNGRSSIPLIVCGQQSLAVFCVGVFLSFVGHFELMMSSGSLFAQIFVSVTGIAIMTMVAYYISWSKRQDKPPPKPAAAPSQPDASGRDVASAPRTEPCSLLGIRGLPRGSISPPCDENPPHSLDQATTRPAIPGLRFPCSAKAAPWGSLQRTIQLPSGKSNRTFEDLAAAVLHPLQAASSISPTLK